MIRIVNEGMIGRLYDQLKSAVYKVMTSPEFGFSDDEVDEYSVVLVKDDGDRIKAEVRAELNYDDLLTLKEACDPIVQRFDPDAYFDMEDSGIIVAYISKD